MTLWATFGTSYCVIRISISPRLFYFPLCLTIIYEETRGKWISLEKRTWDDIERCHTSVLKCILFIYWWLKEKMRVWWPVNPQLFVDFIEFDYNQTRHFLCVRLHFSPEATYNSKYKHIAKVNNEIFIYTREGVSEFLSGSIFTRRYLFV